MKIQSEIRLGRILVHAEITKEDGEVIHEINTAYPLDTPADFIRADLKKAEDLYFSEQKRKKESKKIEKKQQNAEETVKELNTL